MDCLKTSGISFFYCEMVHCTMHRPDRRQNLLCCLLESFCHQQVIYLDHACIFRSLRFSLRICYFGHLALMIKGFGKNLQRRFTRMELRSEKHPPSKHNFLKAPPPFQRIWLARYRSLCVGKYI